MITEGEPATPADDGVTIDELVLLEAAMAVVDDIVAKLDTEPVWRRSIKYKIVPQTTRLIMDYVFADNPDEAVERAIERLELDPNEPFEVHRINESSGVTGSAIKGVKHKYGTV